MTRRTWTDVDADALRHNARITRAYIPRDTRIMAVVKANAYGHGVSRVIPVLRDEVDAFGVASLGEAIEVRALASGRAVFVLSPALPEERVEIVKRGFVPVVSSGEEAAEYSQIGTRLGVRAPVHLVIDTGMGRIGVWHAEALAVATSLAELPGVKVDYVSTHLPAADEDADFTRTQLAMFMGLAEGLRSILGPSVVIQALNSAGILGFNFKSGDMVRAGLMLYGIAPLAAHQSRFRQVFTWKTRVTLVRDIGSGRSISYGRTFISPRPMRVATLAVGYADGYPRQLSGNAACVLIGGVRCPVLGRVTMDQIVVDVGDVPGVTTGSEAVLCGRQGSELILASELASIAGTIPWEIMTRASGLGTA